MSGYEMCKSESAVRVAHVVEEHARDGASVLKLASVIASMHIEVVHHEIRNVVGSYASKAIGLGRTDKLP